MTKNQLIQKYMNIEWCFSDFFYAFCEARGIDDPELIESEEEYSRLEKECEEKITSELLRGLRDVITQDINERISYLMS